jgi:hypothetical protein
MTNSPARLRRLIGVYDADGTRRGELAYFIGARLGRAHCSLCDITHGPVRRTREWQDYQASLAVPFATFHRDDQPDEVRAASGGAVPVVVAETDAGHTVLLEPSDLDACGGSVAQLSAAVDDALARAGITAAP